MKKQEERQERHAVQFPLVFVCVNGFMALTSVLLFLLLC